MGAALKVAKVPTGGDEIGTHALDGVDEHADAVDGSGLALADEVSGRAGVWPETMDDVAVGFVDVRAKVGEPAFGALADFEARYRRGTGDVKRDLEIV